MQCPTCGQQNDPGMKFCLACGHSLLEADVARAALNDGTLAPGTLLKETYEIIRMIGEGGAGAVYEARHINLGHSVAVKVLFAQLSRIEQIRDRFIEEGRIQANLRHPNIVAVSDIVDEGAFVAIVMEYIRGDTLHHFIQTRQEPAPQAKAIHIMLRLLAGLGAAHAKGIVHRDIKPGNIMLAEGEIGMIPKICDFGIAKVTAAKSKTITGTKMGTLHYMAPEQFRDAGAVDIRADIYSLGVTFYELLTGRLPFESDNEFTLMRAHIEIDPPSPREFRSELSFELDRIILRALAKSPDDRFQSCEQFAGALTHIPEFDTLRGYASSPGVALGQTPAPRPPSSARVRQAPKLRRKPTRVNPDQRRTTAGESRADEKPPATQDDAAPRGGPKVPRKLPLFPIFLAIFALGLAGAVAAWFLSREPNGDDPPLGGVDAGAVETSHVSGQPEVDMGSEPIAEVDAPSDTNFDGEPASEFSDTAAGCVALLNAYQGIQSSDDSGADAAPVLAALERSDCRTLLLAATSDAAFDQLYAQLRADQLDIARQQLRARLSDPSRSPCTHILTANRSYRRALQRIEDSLAGGEIAQYDVDAIYELRQVLLQEQSHLQVDFSECL